MNQEIPYLINSLYKACYDDKKTHDFFEKDDLELHFIFKDNSDLSQPIKNNEIVDKIIKKDNAGFINWPFDVAPDIKSGTNLLIIDCYDKTYTSLVENVKSWSRVKKFKIII